MSQNSSCIGQEALVDYLYGESDAVARRRIDAHLRSCARCAGEIGSLTDVRRTIEAWEPPDADLGFRVVASAGGTRVPVHRRPAWALAAAAVLAVAAATVIVRPEVELRGDGMVLRIGWAGGTAAEAEAGGRPSDPAAPRRPAAAPAPGPAPTVAGTPAGLRSGGGAAAVSGSRVGPDPEPRIGDEALLQQVRELIRDDAAARREILDYVRRVSDRR